MLRHLRHGIFAASLLVSSTIFADAPFVVRHIQVQGLQRISSNTVMAAIPLHVGQTYQSEEGNDIIAALFHTGFFSDVQLMRQDNTLVIRVIERPTIDSVNITGNKSIKSAQLKPVLKKLGIVVGDTFDPSELHAIVIGLQQQYALLGRPGAVITPKVTNLSRNRVSIHIVVQEGKATIIHGIHVTGNQAFSEHELLSQFKLTTPGIMTWFNHNDRYSQMRLEDDLQGLQNFYFDRGYLDFHVVSHQVTQLPTGGVTILVTVYEGPIYHLSGYQMSVTKLPDDLASTVKKMLTQFKSGDTF